MKTTRIFLYILILLFESSWARAQYYYYDKDHYATDLNWEIVLGFGWMNCITDIGSRNSAGRNFIRDLNWRNNRPALSLGTSLHYKNAVAIRLEYTQGNILAADSLIPGTIGSAQRNNRNLSFKSRLMEMHLGIEIYPLTLIDKNTLSTIHPFLVSGIGLFHFNPKAKLDDQWYALQPLSLEGQGFNEYPESKPYRLNQFCIPVGIGIKYECHTNLQLVIESLYRLLFTDHLDDVSSIYIDPALFSQYLSAKDASVATRLYNRIKNLPPGTDIRGYARGNPGDRDAYLSFQLKICWRFLLKR